MDGCRRRAPAVVAAATGAMLLLAACGSDGSSGTDPAGPVDIDPASVSGDLTFYGYWLADEIEAMVAEFNKVYPNVRVTTFRAGGPEVAQRFVSEKQAGIATADVISVDTPLMKTLYESGYLETWLPENAATVPAEFKSDYDVAVQLYLNGVVVNTDVFPNKSDWPLAWSDFANPKSSWIGKICTADARTISHGYAQVAALDAVLGREETVAIYNGLGEAGTTIYSSAPQSVTDAANGTCPLVYEVPYQNYVRVKREGAPVEWVIPEPGMVPIQSRISVVEGTPNEAAAKAFATFTLSPAGQALLAGMGLTPTQPDAPSDWWIPGDIGPYSTDLLIQYPEADSFKDQEILRNLFTEGLFGSA